jgi:phage shock protein C
MRFPKPTLLTRDDTILGVCEALGRDFGFNPLFLRVALSAAVLWNPVVIVGGYLAAALVIGAIRIAIPDPAEAPVAIADTPARAPALEPEPLAKAA